MNTHQSFWKADGGAAHASVGQLARPRPRLRAQYAGDPPIPGYRVHRGKGLGYVRLNKQMIYLGKANTPDSIERYRRVVGEWLACGRVRSREKVESAFTVIALIEAYLKWVRSYYVDGDGNISAGVAPIEAAARKLRALYGSSPAAEFGPIALKATRLSMMEDGLCRNVINQRAGCIKRMFRWAVGEELLPPTVIQALSAVEPLRIGRSGARETLPVRPVADVHVEAVLPFLPPTLQAMVKLQRLTGMRSGEICVMRTCDLEIGEKVWLYRPRLHKTLYRGHERVVRVGPKGQAILRQFLCLTRPAGFLFDPARAVIERRQMNGLESDHRQAAGDVSTRYKPRSYNRALHYAMKRAIKAGVLSIEGLWHPHQLRHRHATEIRQVKGLEAARVLLGHRSLSQTLEYAEADAAVAASLALELG